MDFYKRKLFEEPRFCDENIAKSVKKPKEYKKRECDGCNGLCDLMERINIMRFPFNNLHNCSMRLQSAIRSVCSHCRESTQSCELQTALCMNRQNYNL